MAGLARWLKRWVLRAIGIVLCVTAWLIAMGLATLGDDWFDRTIGLYDLGDLLIHGIVDVTGPIGGAVLFALGGVVLLWAFWAPRDTD